MAKPLDEPPKFLQLLPINDFMLAAFFTLADILFFVFIQGAWGFFPSLAFTASTSFLVFMFLIYKNRLPRGYFLFLFRFMRSNRLLVPGRERSELTKTEVARWLEKRK